MLNNYIGGGQVFLHKIRMLKQVIWVTITSSILIGILLAWQFNVFFVNKHKTDFYAAYSYANAHFSIETLKAFRYISFNKNKIPRINAYAKNKLFKSNMRAKDVIKHRYFISSWHVFKINSYLFAYRSSSFAALTMFIMILIWSKFGKSIKADKKKEGSQEILTTSEVNKILQYKFPKTRGNLTAKLSANTKLNSMFLVLNCCCKPGI